MAHEREDFFWKAATLALAFAVFSGIAGAFYFPWQKPLFPNSDFEKGDLSGWSAEGVAFRSQPTYGDNPRFRGRGTANVRGSWWIGTFENRRTSAAAPGGTQGDAPQGRLKSADFTIERDRICFLVGGGNDGPKTGVALEVDGKQVLYEPGRGVLSDSEKMSRVTWDVRPWKGKRARIVIEDSDGGDWGHVNADDFRYT